MACFSDERRCQADGQKGQGHMEHPGGKTQAERRNQADRRACPTTFWSALRRHGRRRDFRRVAEESRAYVDIPSHYATTLLFVVVIGSVLDALLTLRFLGDGGKEANPLMALVLTRGHTPFVGLKMALTGLGAWFLAAHRYFPLAYVGLHALAVAYVTLLLLHVMLLFF
jgi:hypothetical protein